MKTSAILMYVGAALVVLCFFLPWISVSFLGVSMSVSGLNIATGGGTSGVSEMAGGIGSSMLVWIVPLLGVVAAVLGYFGEKQFGSKITGITAVVLGVAPLVYGIYKMIQLNNQLNEAMSSASDLLGSLGGGSTSMSLTSLIGMGLWGTGLGFVLIVAGGVMMIMDKGTTATPAA